MLLSNFLICSWKNHLRDGQDDLHPPVLMCCIRSSSKQRVKTTGWPVNGLMTVSDNVIKTSFKNALGGGGDKRGCIENW